MPVVDFLFCLHVFGVAVPPDLPPGLSEAPETGRIAVPSDPDAALARARAVASSGRESGRDSGRDSGRESGRESGRDSGGFDPLYCVRAQPVSIDAPAPPADQAITDELSSLLTGSDGLPRHQVLPP